ncbi:hypothetical protein MY10362_006670 [Beauveria mimosiformis]
MSVMASRPPNMPAGAGGGGPSKRPRLSLQIKTSCLSGSSFSSGNAAVTSTPNRSRGFPLNPSDPTAFNTLSNAYVTAIERASTPLASPAAAAEPLTAITTLQAISLYSPLGGRRSQPAAASAYPATPVSASSPRRQKQEQQRLRLLPSNSVMSPTPPVSAGAVEGGGGGKGRNSTVFSFSPRDAASGRHSLEQALCAAAAVTIPASPAATIPASPAATPPKKQQQQQQQQPARAGVSGSPPPYTHAKALRSILRNSPLSSRRSASATATTSSPRRLTTPTVRIQQDDAQHQQQQRAAKRVCYHSPIEQEITTNTYTKSHIDLLVEEATASPCSPRRMPVDLLRAFSANEIRDGGQTPGAFEDESKRLGAALRSSGDGQGDGVQKSSSSSSSSTTRGEKKRRWVWTIGREDEEVDEDEEQLGGAVVAAARAAAAAAAAATTAGGSGSGGAPLLSVPTPKRKMETDVADVEMAVMTRMRACAWRD